MVLAPIRRSGSSDRDRKRRGWEGIPTEVVREVIRVPRLEKEKLWEEEVVGKEDSRGPKERGV